MVHHAGFEPATYDLQGRCSPFELMMLRAVVVDYRKIKQSPNYLLETTLALNNFYKTEAQHEK